MPIRLQALEQLREKQAEIDAASDHNAILQLENQVLQECSTHLQNKVSDLKKNLEHARQREAAAQKELASKDESGNALRAALRVSRMQLEASESLLEVKRTQGGLQRKRKKKKKKKTYTLSPSNPSPFWFWQKALLHNCGDSMSEVLPQLSLVKEQMWGLDAALRMQQPGSGDAAAALSLPKQQHQHLQERRAARRHPSATGSRRRLFSPPPLALG